MTLRRRLGLTILSTAVPLAIGLFWLRSDLEHRGRVRGLGEFATGMMRAGGLRACEMDPEGFPEDSEAFARPRPHDGPRGRRPPPGRRPPEERGPRRGPRPHPLPDDMVELWAYRDDFRSDNTEALPFPPNLQRALEGGATAAGERIEHRGRPAIRAAIRMPWTDTPCDYVIVTRVLRKGEAAEGLLLWGLLALCGGVLLSVLLAAGPIVRRIRRLQGDVKRVAKSRYTVDVAVEGKDEVADLATAFNEAGAEVRRHLGEIEERERTLRGFVANTTHDVMIPLTVLQGHLTALRRGAEQGNPPDLDTVRQALEESHYLGSLIQNLSAVAKLEAGAASLEREPVDLNRLVERVAARHAPIAKAKGIELAHAIPEAPVVCPGDVTLLEQAVSNLVHNAVRYGREGGHVSLSLDPTGDGFVLKVLDDGPGVSDAVLARLTDRRFRSEAARTRHPDGSGLGLAIARDVADRHGLELDFRSRPEGGLEATLRGEGSAG
jgi:signal transduction histidine kinase